MGFVYFFIFHIPGGVPCTPHLGFVACFWCLWILVNSWHNCEYWGVHSYVNCFFWPFFHIWMNGSFLWNFSNLLKITEMVYFSKILPKSHHIGSYNFIWMISYNVCVNPQLWPCCIWFWRQIYLKSDFFTVISMNLFVWTQYLYEYNSS